MSSNGSHRWLLAVAKLVPLLCCLAAWHVVASFGLVNSQLLPTPAAVFEAGRQLITGNEIAANMGITILTALGGLAAGAIFGVPIGAAMAVSQVFDDYAEPIVRSTYSLPKTALVPLFLLWFGVGITTNGIVVALACILPIIIYTYHGIRDVPKILMWSALSLGVRRPRLMRVVMLPSAQHAIFVGLRIALGFSFVLAISAEMIVANKGIGKLMFLYGENGAYDYMYAAAIMVVVLAFLADRMAVALIEWRLRWVDPGQRAK